MKILMLIFFLILILSCNSQQKEKVKESKLASLQLSPDDKQMLFSYFINNQGAIYTCDIDGRNVKPLLSPKGKETYTHPRYSPDGTKILFIEFSEDLNTSAIFIVDKTGKNKRQITNFSKLTLEAIFSKTGDSIFYCKANGLKKYSPIAGKSPHDMDVYVVNINLKQEYRLTNFGAYSIRNLTLSQKGNSIMFNEDANLNFIHLSNPNKKHTFHLINFNSLNILGYSNFITKNSEIFYFLAMGNYVLFKVNMNEKKAVKILQNNFQINNLGVFNNENKMFFLKNISGNKTVTFLDLDSLVSKDIPIRIK